MRRSFYFSALISITLFSISAFGQSTPTWQKVSSTEGKFEISFPFKPESNQNSFGTGDNKVTMTILAAEVPEGAFMVAYTDFNSDIPDPEDALLRSQKGSLGSADGTLVSASATTFMGYPARDFKLRVNPSGDLNMFASVRTVLVGRRLYQVVVVTSESNLETPMFKDFLSSFRLSSSAVVAKK